MQSEKSKLTRNGVCRNIDFSPYNFTYFYKDKVITFNFSSKLHLDKFVKLRQNNWSMIYNYLYKLLTDNELLYQLKLRLCKLYRIQIF